MAVMLWNFIEFKVVIVVGCYSMLWGKPAYGHQKDVNYCCSFEPSAIIGAKNVATFFAPIIALGSKEQQ